MTTGAGFRPAGGISAGSRARPQRCRAIRPHSAKTVPGKINVAIMQIEPLGNYAAKIVFDDMHSTGIYGWDYLRDLGENEETRWQAYLDELAAKGLSREQAARPV